MLSAWDVDRAVSQRATRSWADAISPSNSPEYHIILDDNALITYILPFISTTIMDPSTTYITLVPSHSGDSAASSQYATPPHPRKGVPIPPPSIRKALERESTPRAEEEPEPIEDRNARLRVGALGALRWIFGMLSVFSS